MNTNLDRQVHGMRALSAAEMEAVAGGFSVSGAMRVAGMAAKAVADTLGSALGSGPTFAIDLDLSGAAKAGSQLVPPGGKGGRPK